MRLFAALLALNFACATLGAAENAPSFRNHIQPILAKAGCSLGACHGAAAGQGGFDKAGLAGDMGGPFPEKDSGWAEVIGSDDCPFYRSPRGRRSDASARSRPASTSTASPARPESRSFSTFTRT